MGWWWAKVGNYYLTGICFQSGKTAKALEVHSGDVLHNNVNVLNDT